jgi:ATP-binding cassette subfamily F protein uup
MLDRVSTVVLGLDGSGGAESFADYSQWEVWQGNRKQSPRAAVKVSSAKPASAAEMPAKKKLSYLEAREFSTIEERLAQAEQALQEKRAAAENPDIASDAGQLLHAHSELEQAQKAVDQLYSRWAELEEKKG